MKRLLLIACTSVLPGCLASFGLQLGNVGVPSTQPSVGPGGSFSATRVNARISGDSAAGVVVGAGVMGVLFGGAGERAPELDPLRVVREQDCSKALPDSAANLRCR